METRFLGGRCRYPSDQFVFHHSARSYSLQSTERLSLEWKFPGEDGEGGSGKPNNYIVHSFDMKMSQFLLCHSAREYTIAQFDTSKQFLTTFSILSIIGEDGEIFIFFVEKQYYCLKCQIESFSFLIHSSIVFSLFIHILHILGLYLRWNVSLQQ